MNGRSGTFDRKPYVEHDPLFGYRYIPGTKLDLPRPGGGQYRIQINTQGIRSDREYSLKKPPGVTWRIIVSGDSMAAGQFLSNAHRFTELLERRNPGLEVINLALEGSGTDQQVLLYEHVGLRYEHDLVMLFPFLQNVRRNMVEAREGIDPKTGQRVLRSKPRFELVDGRLMLKNVPVPKEVAESAITNVVRTDAGCTWKDRLKTRLSSIPAADMVKRIVYAILPWEPFPEYQNPHSPEWQLMAAIIGRFKELAGFRPLVVVPTFYSNYVRFRMARNYWRRYASLASTPGIHAVDVLPQFRAQGADARLCFQEPHDMHFSAVGNLVLADALQQTLESHGWLA